MSILEKIKQDLVVAVKSRDAEKTGAIRFLLAVLQNQEIEKRARVKEPLTDAEVQETVLKEIKKRKESILLYQENNRKDLADAEQRELEIISVYAPKLLGEEEIKVELEAMIRELGITDLGSLMKQAALRFKGRAEMSLVSRLARQTHDSSGRS
jgi:hypothetical protein